MENLANLAVIKTILTQNGFTFSKSMGQNFLINPGICPKMAGLCGTDENTGVLEIGPGIGVLTHELAKISKKVVSVELDRRLPDILKKTLEEHKNVKIISGDILKIDINSLIKDEFEECEKVVVCANLPYYITSPVIMKILEEGIGISSLTVMVQRETAERLCALPPSRQSGAVTVAVRYRAEPQMLFHVSRGSFFPAPNVDSSVIRLDIFPAPAVCVKDEEYFFRIIRSGFGQRRKTLLNSLSSGLSLPKGLISEALEKAGLKQTARAEELSLNQFARISDFLTDLREDKP